MAGLIQFTEEGRKTLHALHIDSQRRIKAALKKLPQNPNAGKQLTGRLQGFFSLRVAKYRVIYTLDGGRVIVHYAGHRRDAYDNVSH